ncbi:DUF420 domain-containing protein [Chengkuizengella axinellae]|uniref:DUF420 domain-containing protein n=1 Tax=Chengkuizengella axinellae TaxID=3064388 RepID=A0ABT9J1X0_9BACL|nr:DUF420 domain-containing protein [Chengkuizengella sp. 2205SS18-9]MDP5275603.1 DUF420 domain-containing protein [Chengkuizengella sp. 2205SS18-9]
MTNSTPVKQRNFTPFIIAVSIILVAVIALLYFLPSYEAEVGFDITILPMLNAIFNSFTFIFLLLALIAIKRKNIKVHRNFILMAFTTTFLFLISYVTYHSLSESTKYGGDDFLRYIYFFVLLSHILLSIVIVPLALMSITRGFNMQIERHRKIARWTMPIWLYVSFTGVLVYLMISPYY